MILQVLNEFPQREKEITPRGQKWIIAKKLYRFALDIGALKLWKDCNPQIKPLLK